MYVFLFLLGGLCFVFSFCLLLLEGCREMVLGTWSWQLSKTGNVSWSLPSLSGAFLGTTRVSLKTPGISQVPLVEGTRKSQGRPLREARFINESNQEEVLIQKQSCGLGSYFLRTAFLHSVFEQGGCYWSFIPYWVFTAEGFIRIHIQHLKFTIGEEHPFCQKLDYIYLTKVRKEMNFA